MNKDIHEFAKSVGMDAGARSVEAYKQSHDDFVEEWGKPMAYSSGYTAYSLTHAFSEDWIKPLQRKVRNTIIALIVTIILLISAVLYSWSIMDFDTFVKFITAFIPVIVALLLSCAKTYKTWAEAKKTLAEAKIIEDQAISQTESNSMRLNAS